ncbi:MAG: hypothetical protein JSR80_07810 [Verrucomicrobia bacterium]|nr:hypothetical protein [Verrucomicrobiota bacterium]
MRLLILLLFCQSLYAHLILQFDINGTLIAMDSATDADLSHYLNRILYDHVYPSPPPLSKEERYYFLDLLRAAGDPHLEEMEERYHEMWEKLGGENKIFPSFFKLLDYLEEEQISYSLSLRTFGWDLEETREQIEDIYPHLFKNSGYFRQNVLHLDGQPPISSLHIQYELLADHNFALRDDFRYWSTHDREARYGKPLLIDPLSEDLPLFFDDNIPKDPHSLYGIVDPIDVRTGLHLPPACVRHHLLRVNTAQAILDDNYFIDLVEEALTYNKAAA